jgi:hypothetical protein
VPRGKAARATRAVSSGTGPTGSEGMDMAALLDHNFFAWSGRGEVRLRSRWTWVWAPFFVTWPGSRSNG